MRKLSLLFVLLTLISLLVSCGKKTKDDVGQELSTANAYLNSKDYNSAIDVLQSALDNYPDSKELKVKMAHAYAGAGGFEALVFAGVLRDLGETNLAGNIKGFLDNIEIALAKLPSLSTDQKEKLDNAIKFYKSLGYDPFKTTKEVNFKWGVLHTYRLLVTVKEMAMYTKIVLKDNSNYTEDDIQKFFITKLDVMAQDFYKSYQLFRHSFDKLSLIALKAEDLIQNTISDDEFKIKVDARADNYRDFASDFIQDNKEIISLAIARIADKIDLLDIEGSIRKIALSVEEGKNKIASNTKEKIDKVSGEIKDSIDSAGIEESLVKLKKSFNNNQEDVEKRIIKLSILARLFIGNVVLDNTDHIDELSYIFNYRLKQDYKSAVALALQEKSLRPINDFFNNNSSSVYTLGKTWKILSNSYNKYEMSEFVDPEVEVLLSYIDREELKILTEKSNLVAKKVEKSIMDGTGELELENGAIVEDVMNQVDYDVNDFIDSSENTSAEVQEIIEETEAILYKKNKNEISDLDHMINQDAADLGPEVEPYLNGAEEALEYQDDEFDEKAPEYIDDVKDYIED